MTKEPLALYIFRFLVGLGLFIFLLMTYWSSSLLEKDLKTVLNEVEVLKNELHDLRSSFQQKNFHNSESASESNSKKEYESSKWPKIDPSLPNLLEEDPFYEKTLPNMLGSKFKARGTFHSTTLGRPENVHPFSQWAQVSTWNGMCTVNVARLKFGIYETMAPDMAVKMEERKNSEGKTEYWVFLRDNVFWQPLSSDLFPGQIVLAPQFRKKVLVTSEDYKFFFDAMMNPFVQEPGAVSSRIYFGDIEELRVIDKLTFVVRWKTEKIEKSDGTTVEKNKYVAKQLTGGLRPLPSHVYKYFADGSKIVENDSNPDTYRTNSVWAQNFSQHWAKNVIISCGPWIFDGMSERQIRFKRNQDHYSRYDVLAEGSEIEFKETFDAMWQDFKSNRIDSYDIRPDQLLELDNFMATPEYEKQKAQGAAIRRLEYVARGYFYIGWNQAKPFFRSNKVRKAMTMAIDRQRIIRQNLNGLGIEINGPFSVDSPAYNHSIVPWPYDPYQAKRLLEEEGWFDSDGDGIIDKVIDGKVTPFRFSLTYYVKNSTTKAICEYISTALREIGVEAMLHGVDMADLSAAFDEKSFDAVHLGWVQGTPPEDPKQLWYSAGAKEKGSSNAVGFANKEADAIIDRLTYESDPKKRLELYHRFGEIIHEEAPYTFLYNPKTVMVYREYLQNVFIPSERQDLIPGANIGQPSSSIFWLKK